MPDFPRIRRLEVRRGKRKGKLRTHRAKRYKRKKKGGDIPLNDRPQLIGVAEVVEDG